MDLNGVVEGFACFMIQTAIYHLQTELLEGSPSGQTMLYQRPGERYQI